MLGVHNQHLLQILHKHPPLEAGCGPRTFDLLNKTFRSDQIPLFDIVINKSHLNTINILTATSSNCASCARIGGNARTILGSNWLLISWEQHFTEHLQLWGPCSSVMSSKNMAAGSYINHHFTKAFMRRKTVVSACVIAITFNASLYQLKLILKVKMLPFNSA